MILKKPGMVLNLLYLSKINNNDLPPSFMKEILLQILLLLPMSLMTFSKQLLRKCNSK